MRRLFQHTGRSSLAEGLSTKRQRRHSGSYAKARRKPAAIAAGRTRCFSCVLTPGSVPARITNSAAHAGRQLTMKHFPSTAQTPFSASPSKNVREFPTIFFSGVATIHRCTTHPFAFPAQKPPRGANSGRPARSMVTYVLTMCEDWLRR